MKTKVSSYEISVQSRFVSSLCLTALNHERQSKTSEMYLDHFLLLW
jgi:hypothetical protein